MITPLLISRITGMNMSEEYVLQLAAYKKKNTPVL